MDISNGKNVTLITGSQYADKILNRGTKVTLKSNNGNDDVENYGENSKIYLSYGDDYARNYAAKVTIDGNAGNDRIVNTGNDSSISAGAGYDSVENYGDYSTINISVGNNYVLNEGAGTKINGGIGDDSIDNKGDKTIIKSGGGSDIISSNAEYVSIDSGANNNTLLNYGDYASIKTGNGNNYTFNQGNKVTIQGGKGYNGVSNYGEYVLVSMTGGTNYIYDYYDRNTIIGGAGNDSIFSNGHTGLYKSGGGSDSVTATGDFFTLDGGAGNDRISVNTDYSSIEGGAGVDTINAIGDRNYISGGAGNDIITSNGDKVTLETGKGDDMVFATGENLQILLDGDNNALFLEAMKNSTIITGKGSDYISADESSALFIEAGTGGDDEISGFAANDTIKMASAVKNSYIDGNDFVIEFAKGSFRIQDFGYNSIQAVNTSGELVTLNAQPEGLNIENKKNKTAITGGEGADTISNSGSNVTITSGKGNDSITNSGSKTQITLGLGNNTITNSGSNTSIDGGEGGLTLTNSGKGATINGGKDSNTITNTANSVLINCGEEYDDITTNGKNVTIVSGAGTNYIKITAENTGTVVKYSADSNGILLVDGLGSNDTLDLNGANYLKINNGIYFDILVEDKLISILNNEDFQINGVQSSADTYTIKENLSLTVNGVLYKASGGNAVINLDSDSKVTGLTSGKVIASADNANVTIDATKGAQIFKAEVDNNSLIITKTLPVTFTSGDFVYAGESITAAEKSNFTVLFEGEEYSRTRAIFSNADSTYKISDTEFVINSNSCIVTDTLTEGDNVNVVSYEFSGKVTHDLSDNSIKVAKGTTGGILLNVYEFEIAALNSSGGKFISDNDGVSFTPDSGAINIALSYLEQNTIMSGDLNCTNGKITIGYDNQINFADDTTFTLTKDGYTFNVTADNDSKIAMQLENNQVTFAPVADEGTLALTLKKGKNTILDNTLTISGGSVVLSTTDNVDRRKISFAQGTTFKIEKDNKIITATAAADTAAYFWRDNKGLAYFKIDGESANFNLSIAELDGTETFNGELTFGGCLAYNEKSNAFEFISDPSTIDGYETFVQIKNDEKTICAQTNGKTFSANLKFNDGKITASFSNASNNSLLLQITKNETETFNDTVTVNGAVVIDVPQMEFSANKNAVITTAAGISIKNSLLTVSKDFSGSKLDLENYGNIATKVDASKVSTAMGILGNSSANSIKSGKGDDIINAVSGNNTVFGGAGSDNISSDAGNDILQGEAGNDTLIGGAGNNTLTGGKGNDVFIYGGGNDFITDYKSGEDSILLDTNAITSSTLKGSDVILTTDSGTLTLKATKNNAITFTDEEGNTTDLIFFEDISYTPLEKGLSYDSKRTVLTVSNEFEDYGINLENYLPTVIKVNAGAFKDSIIITGNDLDNSIKGGKGDDFIYGGAGNDTLTGGKGADIFVYGEGNDVITDYKAGEDSIMMVEEISSISYNGADVIFAVGEGSLTVKNAKGKEITVTDLDDQTQIYSRMLDILHDNNFMTDEFNISDIVAVTENNYSVGKIETSADTEKIGVENSIAFSDSFNKTEI